MNYIELMEEATRRYLFPGQDPYEFSQLLEYLEDRKLHRILEIGTYQGCTIWALAQVAPDDAVIASVDNYSQAQVTVSSEEIARNKQRVALIYGDSTAESTLTTVREHFEDQPLDLLLIDGDHTYEVASSDWQMYGSLVRSGGVVAFHDICPTGLGVKRLWEEIKATEKYQTHEFFAKTADAAGLGVLDIPKERDRL